MIRERNGQKSPTIITTEERQAINIFRVLAILCVLAAHVIEDVISTPTSLRDWIRYILNPVLASLGVPCFLC